MKGFSHVNIQGTCKDIPCPSEVFCLASENPSRMTSLLMVLVTKPRVMISSWPVNWQWCSSWKFRWTASMRSCTSQTTCNRNATYLLDIESMRRRSPHSTNYTSLFLLLECTSQDSSTLFFFGQTHTSIFSLNCNAVVRSSLQTPYFQLANQLRLPLITPLAATVRTPTRSYSTCIWVD